MYKAENIDTDKILEAINEARKLKHREADTNILIENAKREAYTQALSDVESMFHCSNYEKKGGEQ